MTGDGFVYHKKDCQLFADPFIIEGRHCTCGADHKNRCPFCGTHVAHSPFGNVWCDQCDLTIDTAIFARRPLEDELNREIARLRKENEKLSNDILGLIGECDSSDEGEP